MDYNIIRKLFPLKLLNHETFSIFVELTARELSQVFDYISLMTTLSNVDRCPEVFITHLAELVDFDWTNLLGSEEQRECMKYSWDAHNKYKGTKEDLELMATYGDVEGYQGGHLFVPGMDIDLGVKGSVIFDDYEMYITETYYQKYNEELQVPQSIYNISTEEIDLADESINLNIAANARPRAVVTLPRESLFTFDKSEFSGDDYLPDNIVYKEGTILIEVTRLTEEIKRKVETVKPAGMLVVYKYIKDGTFEYITHTKTAREVNG